MFNVVTRSLTLFVSSYVVETRRLAAAATTRLSIFILNIYLMSVAF